MTTRTQWVRNMADSHLNRSMLQRLSLMWPGTLARRDRRSPFPAGSDGREFFELRLCRFGCGTPRRSVERFADSPNGDYVASSRRPHERVVGSVLSGRTSGGASMRTACGIFACSWLCEWLAVSRASIRLQYGADGLDAPRVPSSQRGCGPTSADWACVAGSDSQSAVGA